MSVLPENAQEIASIAGEVGAEILAGHLRYPSETDVLACEAALRLDDIDLDEYLARHRDRRLVLIIAPVSGEEPMTFTCGICGFVMDRAGECPQCRLQIEEAARGMVDSGEDRAVLDQVADLLDGGEDEPG